MNIKPIRVYFSNEKNLYSSIKNIFGFYPKNIFLFRQATLHKSLTKEAENGIRVNNERLEFLGDAVLDLVVADYLFKMFPTKDEGFLTEIRARIVNRMQLNKISEKLGIDKLIIHSPKGNCLFRSIKGNTFEALIGAIYLDRGYNFTKKIIINRIIGNYININDLVNNDLNYKSKLLEWSQKNKKPIEFVTVDQIGTSYNKQYVVNVLIENKIIGIGQNYSIKRAEQDASYSALNNISMENNKSETLINKGEIS